jgi:ABC-2 type transport system permease protein
VPRWQLMLGKTLGGATVASIQGLIVFLLALMVGFRVENPWMLPVAAVLVFLVALLFTSLGIAIASGIEDMQGFQLIMNFLVMPIFFLSGALFPLQGLPKAMEIITRFDPLTYGIDGVRAVLLNTSTFGLPTDFLIITILTAIVLGIGTYLFERIQI